MALVAVAKSGSSPGVKHKKFVEWSGGRASASPGTKPPSEVSGAPRQKKRSGLCYLPPSLSPTLSRKSTHSRLSASRSHCLGLCGDSQGIGIVLYLFFAPPVHCTWSLCFRCSPLLGSFAWILVIRVGRGLLFRIRLSNRRIGRGVVGYLRYLLRSGRRRRGSDCKFFGRSRFRRVSRRDCSC